MTKPIFQMSADARLLMQRLAETAVGETIPYADLSATISRPVASANGALQTALRRLLRDKDMVFATVRGIGVQRLSDAAIVDDGHRSVESIRRKARRSVERQMKADFSKLDRERQGRFSAQVSVMGAITMMARSGEIDRIAKAMTPERRELPFAETLKMFAAKD